MIKRHTNAGPALFQAYVGSSPSQSPSPGLVSAFQTEISRFSFQIQFQFRVAEMPSEQLMVIMIINYYNPIGFE